MNLLTSLQSAGALFAGGFKFISFHLWQHELLSVVVLVFSRIFCNQQHFQGPFQIVYMLLLGAVQCLSGSVRNVQNCKNYGSYEQKNTAELESTSGTGRHIIKAALSSSVRVGSRGGTIVDNM